MTQSDFDAILKLSDHAFGKSYLSASMLQAYKQNGSAKVLIYKSGDELLGFSIVELIPARELSDKLKIEADALQAEVDRDDLLGYRKMMAVNKAHQGQGIMKQLFERGQRYLQENGARMTLSTAWVHAGESPLANFLKKEGFEQVMQLPKYWYEESEGRKFECTACGQPPCTCNAVLLRRDFNADTSRID